MKPIDKEEGVSDAPFNMSLFYYKDLIELVRMKDEAYLKNDLKNWYKGLYTIFKRIVFKLKADEEKEIQDLIDSARNKLEKNDKTVNQDLHIIDIKIIKLMDHYKMIFPRIDTTRGLDRLNKRYGLEDD